MTEQEIIAEEQAVQPLYDDLGLFKWMFEQSARLSKKDNVYIIEIGEHYVSWKMTPEDTTTLTGWFSEVVRPAMLATFYVMSKRKNIVSLFQEFVNKYEQGITTEEKQKVKDEFAQFLKQYIA